MAGVKITLDSARRVSELLSRDRNQPPRNRKRNTRPVDDGPVNFGFRLLEDASGGAVSAKIFSIDMIDELIPYATVRYKWNILGGARAGYEGDCVLYRDEFWFVQGPCVVKCLSSGSISGALVDGKVGVAYGGSISLSNIDSGSVSVSGLPSGMSGSSSGAISGSPTESGTFLVIVSGTAPKTGPTPVVAGSTCTITKAFMLLIEA